MSYKRKGFTLVELLIVIVVIGILSAMMMLSSTEAVTSAKASNIATNLRNLKTAALAFYTDNLDTFNKELSPSDSNATKFTIGNVVKYLKAGKTSVEESDTDLTGYECYADGSHWYVAYTQVNDSRIKDKLKGRAKSVQLLGGTVSGAVFTPTSGKTAYENEQVVAMLVLQKEALSSSSNP